MPTGARPAPHRSRPPAGPARLVVCLCWQAARHDLTRARAAAHRQGAATSAVSDELAHAKALFESSEAGMANASVALSGALAQLRELRARGAAICRA